MTSLLTGKKVLYSAPRARLHINNTLSLPLSLLRGTRQGCPLSPLFALAVEPLATLIRGTPDIVGIRRGLSEEKISLYADDALIYFGDTTTSLQTLMALITKFGNYFSGFSINLLKSILMPLDPLTNSLPPEAGQIAIPNSFRYLGVVATPNTSSFLKFNFGPLLDKQREKCLSWCKLPLLVVGRVNLIKMIWAPQLLYVTLRIPLCGSLINGSKEWISRCKTSSGNEKELGSI